MRFLDVVKNLFLFGTFAGIIAVGILSMLSLTPISYESTQNVVKKEPEVLGVANNIVPQSSIEALDIGAGSGTNVFSSDKGQIIKFFVTSQKSNPNNEFKGITIDMRNDTQTSRIYALRVFPIAHNVSSFGVTVLLNGKRVEKRVMSDNKIFESQIVLQPTSSLSLDLKVTDLIVGTDNQVLETEFQFEVLLKDGEPN